MNICLIDGSPKPKGSTSGRILTVIEQNLGLGHQYTRFDTAVGNPDALIESLGGSDVILLAFPLYADGIPAHLLRLLTAVENTIISVAKGAVLYVIVNNGFYEARQNTIALSMTRIFCEKSGLVWGQGLAIGGGGMLASAPLTIPLMKSIRNVLVKLADNIQTKKTAETLFAQPDIPRRFYIIGAHMGWRMSAKQNGVSRKALRGKQSLSSPMIK